MAKKPDYGNIQRSLVGLLSTSPDQTGLVGASTGDIVIGIRSPFAMEYLLDCSVLPLGVCLELAGLPGSNKSTLGYEIVRWIASRGGYSDVFLTEGKNSPALAYSLCGYEDEWDSVPFLTHMSEDMCDWQRQVTNRIQEIRTLFRKGSPSHGLPKNTAPMPVGYVVDSIMGQMVTTSSDKISKEGSSGRGFALEAGSLTTWLRVVQSMIAAEPMIAVFINHEKHDKVNEYRIDKRTPGGNQVKFQMTFRLSISKKQAYQVVDPDRTAAYIRGHNLVAQVRKNSLGDDGRSITIPYRWFHDDPPEGQPELGTRQRGLFDWNSAIPLLLLNELENNNKTQEAKKAFRDKLDSIVHIRLISGDRWESKTFGATKTSSISTSELGERIQADENILNGLRNLFGIKRYTPWDCQSNFYAVRRELRKRRAQNAYKVMEKATKAVKGK